MSVKITIDDNEINAAITEYITQKIPTVDASTVSIEITQQRSPKGNNAEVTFEFLGASASSTPLAPTKRQTAPTKGQAVSEEPTQAEELEQVETAEEVQEEVVEKVEAETDAEEEAEEEEHDVEEQEDEPEEQSAKTPASTRRRVFQKRS